MKIFSLSSGSKGNATFVNGGNTRILIDAGISFLLLKKRLEEGDENILNLDGILITHEHSDHIKGLPFIVKNIPNIKIYAHTYVCNALNDFMPIISNNLCPIVSPVFYLKDLTIEAFKLSHDCSTCLGFNIFYSESKFSYLTDFGYAEKSLPQILCDSKLIFVESNHNEKLLHSCKKYSESLKRRILSEQGHMSNNACANLILEILKIQGEKKFLYSTFVLCHLSENTNTDHIAFHEVSTAILDARFDNVKIFIAPQYGISEVFYI